MLISTRPLDSRLSTILETAHHSPQKTLALLDATQGFAAIDAERRRSTGFNLMLLGLNISTLATGTGQAAKLYWPADCQTPTCEWGALRIAQTVLAGTTLACVTAGMCMIGLHHQMARRDLSDQQVQLAQGLEAQTGLGLFVGLYAAASAKQRAQVVRMLEIAAHTTVAV